jgi:site-specific recombinase XerD
MVGEVRQQFRRAMLTSPKGYSSQTVTKRVAMVGRYLDAVPNWQNATPFDIEDWASSQGWGPSSLRDGVSHVRAFYKWAIRHGHALSDPTATVELPRAPKRLPRPARDVAIAAAVTFADPAVTAMLALMAGAGLRCIEVSRLRWSDVDMLAGTVHVHGKFDRERVIEIGAPVRRALAAIDGDGAFVFTSTSTGRPHSACRVSQIVNAQLRLVSAGCTAHQLRHRFATRALAECHDLTTVRDLLGHTSVSTTEIYAAVTPGAAGTVSRSVTVPGL